MTVLPIFQLRLELSKALLKKDTVFIYLVLLSKHNCLISFSRCNCRLCVMQSKVKRVLLSFEGSYCFSAKLTE